MLTCDAADSAVRKRVVCAICRASAPAHAHALTPATVAVYFFHAIADPPAAVFAAPLLLPVPHFSSPCRTRADIEPTAQNRQVPLKNRRCREKKRPSVAAPRVVPKRQAAGRSDRHLPRLARREREPAAVRLSSAVAAAIRRCHMPFVATTRRCGCGAPDHARCAMSWPRQAALPRRRYVVTERRSRCAP